jgi:hypothetical protein
MQSKSCNLSGCRVSCSEAQLFRSDCLLIVKQMRPCLNYDYPCSCFLQCDGYPFHGAVSTRNKPTGACRRRAYRWPQARSLAGLDLPPNPSLSRTLSLSLGVCVWVCPWCGPCAFVCARVCVCVRACARACVCVHGSLHAQKGKENDWQGAQLTL